MEPDDSAASDGSDSIIHFAAPPPLLFHFALTIASLLSFPLLDLGCSWLHLSIVACLCRHVVLVVETDRLVLCHNSGIGDDPGVDRVTPRVPPSCWECVCLFESERKLLAHTD